MRYTKTVPLLMIAALASCTGSDGLVGPQGPAGADGTAGPQGPAGTNFPGPAPAAYTAADGILGGAAYAKWWTTDAAGSGTQPTTTAGADY